MPKPKKYVMDKTEVLIKTESLWVNEKIEPDLYEEVVELETATPLSSHGGHQSVPESSHCSHHSEVDVKVELDCYEEVVELKTASPQPFHGDHQSVAQSNPSSHDKVDVKVELDCCEEVVELKTSSPRPFYGDQSVAESNPSSHDNKLDSSAPKTCTSADLENKFSEHYVGDIDTIKKEYVPEEYNMVETVPFESVWICKEEVKEESGNVSEFETFTHVESSLGDHQSVVSDQCEDDNVVQVNNRWVQTTVNGSGEVCKLTKPNCVLLDMTMNRPQLLATSLGAAEVWKKLPMSSPKSIPIRRNYSQIGSVARKLTSADQQNVDCTRTSSFYAKGKASKRKTSSQEMELPTGLFQSKRNLQIECLKLENYKTKLEIRKLELELGLLRSKCTSDLSSCKL